MTLKFDPLIQAKAESWIHAWNSHDPEAVLSHYADDVVFTSPYVALRFDPSGTIHGKDQLRLYVGQAFQRVPDLRFHMLHALEGWGGMTILYRAVLGYLAAETHVFNSSGQIERVHCHYAATTKPANI